MNLHWISNKTQLVHFSFHLIIFCFFLLQIFTWIKGSTVSIFINLFQCDIGVWFMCLSQRPMRAPRLVLSALVIEVPRCPVLQWVQGLRALGECDGCTPCLFHSCLMKPDVSPVVGKRGTEERAKSALASTPRPIPKETWAYSFWIPQSPQREWEGFRLFSSCDLSFSRAGGSKIMAISSLHIYLLMRLFQLSGELLSNPCGMCLSCACLSVCVHMCEWCTQKVGSKGLGSAFWTDRCIYIRTMIPCIWKLWEKKLYKINNCTLEN